MQAVVKKIFGSFSGEKSKSSQATPDLKPVKTKLKLSEEAQHQQDLADFTTVRGNSIESTRAYIEEIPVAEVRETSLEYFEAKDWRSIFSAELQGRGLEIGPLHRPLVKHPGMDVLYIDRLSVADLREHYPELAGLPLVEPDIIGDAEDLATVPDKEFDFLVSAHVIEHMISPLRSLENWLRVLKPGGMLYLIVPDKRAIFDRKRPRTTLEHIIDDYYNPSTDKNFQHYLDYATFVHDKEGLEALADAERLVEEDYSIHFHVFIPTDIINLIKWFSKHISPCNIIKGPSMTPGSDEFNILVQKPMT